MFSLGRTVATPGALRALEAACMTPADLLRRHRQGDWGEIHPDDRGLNEAALASGGRLMSVYPLRTGETVWGITEWDRSVTTLLLPEDY
jgi:hypothetical protein